MKKNFTYSLSSITITLSVIVMLVFVACRSTVKQDRNLEIERDSAAVMKSYGVTTLISDSGVTRFRVETPEWLVFDKLARPCWKFPQGLHLEQFDQELKVHSEVDAQKAIYYSNEEKWVLSDSVHAMNVEGEYFETDSLFVLQKEDRIYTNSYVKITQKERIIRGVGMVSNQRLTRYTILKPQGVIPIDEEPQDSVESPSIQEP